MGTILCPPFTALLIKVLEYSNLARWIGLVETNLLPFTSFVFGQVVRSNQC